MVDFLSTNETTFPLLSQVISEGLVKGKPAHGVAVINLNLRSVVTDPLGYEGGPKEWGRVHPRSPRASHDAREVLGAVPALRPPRDKCYAFHNVRTFQDETAGPKVTERLKSLYTLTHLRGRLHITLRDLRSALAFMLVGTRDCAEIHELYRAGPATRSRRRSTSTAGWAARGRMSTASCRLLREVDIGLASDPKLDRSLDFVSPAADHSLFRFGERGSYDREVLRRLFEDLPREFSGKLSAPSHSRTPSLRGDGTPTGVLRTSGWRLEANAALPDWRRHALIGERRRGHRRSCCPISCARSTAGRG